MAVGGQLERDTQLAGNPILAVDFPCQLHENSIPGLPVHPHQLMFDPPEPPDPADGPWERADMLVWPLTSYDLPYGHVLTRLSVDRDGIRHLLESLSARFAPAFDTCSSATHNRRRAVWIPRPTDPGERNRLGRCLAAFIGPFTLRQLFDVPLHLSIDRLGVTLEVPDTERSLAALSYLNGRLRSEGCSVAIGVGAPASGSEGMRLSRQEARTQVQGRDCGIWIQGRRNVLDTLEFANPTTGEAVSAAQELLQPLRGRNPDLISTLVVYLEFGSAAAAAGALGIHRHTLRYRLGLIRDLTEMDPDRLCDLLELFLALKLTGIISCQRLA